MKEIVRVSVISQIAQSIKDSIKNGQFAVDEKLPAEMTLCKKLNVSRSSLREALYTLQAEGYVKLIPGKGAFVRSKSPEDNKDNIREWFISSAPTLEEYMEVRMCVAPLACSLACERADEMEVDELVKIHESFINANEQSDITALVTLDQAFHEQIFKMSHNVFLCKIGELLSKYLKQYRMMSITAMDNSDNTVNEHYTILKAICDKDKNRAQAAMQLHLCKALDGINYAKTSGDKS